MTGTIVAAGKRTVAWFATFSVLSFIGLLVGVSSVILPKGTPFVLVGLAFLVLLWVMPDLRVVPERLGKFLYIPFVVSFLCIPNYYGLITDSMPWISLRRVTVFALLIPVLLTIAGSAHWRAKIGEALRSVPLVRVAMLAMAVNVIVSTVFSISLSNSISGDVNTLQLWCFPFIATLLYVRSPTLIERLMKILLGCLAVDFGLGLVEFVERKPFLFTLLPAHMQELVLANNSLSTTLISGQALRYGAFRAASIYGISLSWGEMAAMMAPLGAHFLAHGRSTWQRMFGCLGLLFSIGSIFCSGSRGGYVAMLASLLCFGGLWVMRAWYHNPKSLLGPFGAAFGAMSASIIIFSVLFVGPVHKAVLGGGETQSSTNARWDQWAMAKPKVLERPLWGYGPTTSGTVTGYYYPGAETPTVDSYLITLMVDYGFPGLISFFAMFLLPIYESVRAYLRNETEASRLCNGLSCSLVAFLVYRITLSQTENMSLAFVILASCLVMRAFTSRPAEARRPKMVQDVKARSLALSA